MKVMVLAAGRGARLRPITDSLPKPLVQLGGRCLVEHQLLALAAAGLRDIVMNVAWLGDAIIDHLGDGSRYGVQIDYSREQPGELDTGGGIVQALPRLGDAPFAVVNADVFTDFPFERLPLMRPAAQDDIHLVLVPNPPHKSRGDFSLEAGRLIRTAQAHTFSGIGVYHPRLFKGLAPGRRSLADVLFAAVDAGRASGELYRGRWHDVGTHESLQALRQAHG
ncbi:MAG: mannose-1-phosphate guanylyltransferase [Salinisphaeraceae bacterium]|nr:mannose-1-phosphate guanylyltransferase [Salinisphaeraceae bacterium]